jgi:hypothetical protein
MAVKRYNGTSWDTVAGLGAQGAAATSSSITTWVKTAAGGETSLTGSSDSSTTLAYTPGQEQFFINGVLQVRGSDYTATNGTSITGISALIAGDVATVTTVNAFSVTGAVPLSTVTANGDLIVGTSSGAVGNLGIGSTGQLLTVAGGVPTWATPASTNPSFSLLSTTTLSGAATFTITGLSGYNTFYMIVKNASGTSAGLTAMRYRINGNTGTIYNSYGVTIDPGASYSTSIATQNVIEGTSLSLGVMSSNAGSQISGYVRLEGCNSSGLKMIQSASGVGPETGNSGANRILGGFINTTSVVSSITFFTDDATNFDLGTLRIYGSVA